MKINRFFALAAVVAALCSCASKEVVLFNGEDLTGWTGFLGEGNEALVDSVYTVKDGNLLVAGRPFGYLRTTEKYGDCTIHMEWRWVGKGTNSGFFVRVQDSDKLWPNAIECQLCAGKAGDFVMLGGSKIQEVECVGDFPVKDRNGDYENPEGEWNTMDVVCKGNSITVYVNGQLQNECTCDSTEGYIALQSEGGPLEFRNITVSL